MLLFLSATHHQLSAQWQDESLLFTATDSAKTGYTHNRNIAVEGQLVHTVWMDSENGKWRPSYRRSTDGGNTWENVVHLADPNTRCPQYHVSLAVQQSAVYVVWSDERSGNSKIYLRRSTDAGESWKADRCITPAGLNCTSPGITCGASSIHVIYKEKLSYASQARYIRSTDGGEHWTEGTTFAEAGFMEVVAMAVVEPVIHTCWYDHNYGNSEIIYRRSTDDGETWENKVRLTEDPGVQNGCTVVASGEDVHVAWHDYRTGVFDIHYVHSLDGGAHWGEEGPIMVTPHNCYFPTLAVSAETVHLAWIDTRNDPGDIYYCRSDDAGRTWGPEEHIISSERRSRYPFLAVSGSALHLLWTDNHKEIHYASNPTGNETGTHTMGSTDYQVDLALDQNYPNPFRAHSTMQYHLPVMAHVRITLYDMLGRERRTLLDDARAPGTHSIQVDGSQFPTGSYLCRIVANGESASRLLTVTQH
ncbi:T9SS type A sorting domain-containing protein [bacterium]|nr:T9SS type A sorting domain-containing protein [bacterium]